VPNAFGTTTLFDSGEKRGLSAVRIENASASFGEIYARSTSSLWSGRTLKALPPFGQGASPALRTTRHKFFVV